MTARKVHIIMLCAAALLAAPLLMMLAAGRARLAHKRFLIIPHLTRIGDLVVTTPLIDSLAKAYPEAEIDVLVSKKVSPLIAADPRISLVLYEEYKNNLFALAFFLGRRRYSAALIASGTALGSVLALFARIPKRLKLTRRPRPLLETLTDWFATKEYRFLRGSRLGDLYATMAADLGATEGAQQLFTTKAGEQKAEQFLQPLTKPVVGMSLFAGNRAKEWDEERFEELCRRLLARGASIVLVAGPGEGARSHALAKRLSSERVRVADDFSLAELSSLIKRFSLWISADTGPMHLAALFGVPTIDIIGPVHHGELTPKGAHVQVVEPVGVAPSIFAFHPAGSAEQARAAAAAISIERVYEAALRVI